MLCDFWGRQLLLGMVTNRTLKVFLWENFLVLGNAADWPRSPGAGGEEPETTGSLPRAALQEQIPFFPLGKLLSTQPLGKKTEKSLHGAGWQKPGPTSGCPTAPGGSSQAGMNSQGKGSLPLSHGKLQDADPWRMLCVWVLQTLRGGCLWPSSVPRLPADPCSGFPDDPSRFPPVPVPLPAHRVHQGPAEAGGS